MNRIFQAAMRRSRTHGLASLALVMGLALPACGPANIVLRNRPGTPGALGPLQRCASGETPCATDPSQDGSRFDPTNAAYFSLPHCPNGIDRILVQNVNSSQPVAIVECAAPDSTPDDGIPTTSSDGGLQPSH